MQTLLDRHMDDHVHDLHDLNRNSRGRLLVQLDMDHHEYLQRAGTRASEVRKRLCDPDGQDSFVGASATAPEVQGAANARARRHSAAASGKDRALAVSEGEAASMGVRMTLRDDLTKAADAADLLERQAAANEKEIARLRQVVAPAAPDIALSFETSVTEDGKLQLQAKDPSRAQLVGIPGCRGVQLTTSGTDIAQSGSGSGERADLNCGRVLSVKQGDKFWLAHSVILGENFPLPIQDWHVFFDFHHAGNTGQTNMQVGFKQNSSIMTVDINGGAVVVQHSNDPGHFSQVIDQSPQKNVRYDFTWYFEWSSNADGVTKLWLRKGSEPIGKLVVNRKGANLYAGIGAYMKLANYHSPAKGKPVSVIHARVKVGKTAASVAMMPLEGTA